MRIGKIPGIGEYNCIVEVWRVGSGGLDAVCRILILHHLAWKQGEVPEDWRRAVSLGRAE